MQNGHQYQPSGLEYDPHNRLKHTDLWFEVGTRAEDEWPKSKNANVRCCLLFLSLIIAD